MKFHIRLSIFLLVFFSAINFSYSQTSKPAGSNNGVAKTDSTQVTDINTAGDAGVSDTSQTGGNVQNSEYLNNLMIQHNTDAPAENVKGKRKPNEYSSGRSGGQYNNPKPEPDVKPKTNTGTENSGAGGEFVK